MSTDTRKVTAHASPVPADERQSLSFHSTGIIPDAQHKSNTNAPDRLHTVSLTELYETVYPPKTQVIDGLLSSGVYLFAGAPKVGKSFLMAQIGYHVSGGVPLWDYAVHQGTVLYLALEDDFQRLQKRTAKMFDMDNRDNFHFATKSKTLVTGLNEQIKQFVAENADTKLVIIDTLQKIREVGGENYSYASDYEIVAQVKQLAEEHNICVLIVHHTRKQSADDCFDTISGTNGLLGAADGAFIMQREKRTDNKAILDIVGRDQQDQRLYLQFDHERCIWQLTRAEIELWKEPPNPLHEAIAELLTPQAPHWCGSASELASFLGRLELQPNVLTRRLNVGADRLWNEYSIRYENDHNRNGSYLKLTLEVAQA